MTITSLARCVRVRTVVVRVGAKITRFIRQLAGQRKVWLKGNEKESAIASSFFSDRTSDHKRGWLLSGNDRSSSKVPPGTRAENSVRWMLTTTALPLRQLERECPLVRCI